MGRGHEPVRMCVICRRRAPKESLARYVLPPGGEALLADVSRTSPGRGWYVCAAEDCQEKFRRFRAGGRKRKGVSE